MLPHKSKFNRPLVSDYVILLLLIVYGLIIVYPFYYTLVVSLISQTEFMQTKLVLFPKNITLESYKFVLSSPMIVSGFAVSVVLTVAGTLYSMLLTVSFAYVMTKPIPGNKLFHYIMIFTMYFSGGLIPTYILIQKLGLLDSLFSIILPAGINISYVLIIMRFFKEIPASLEESARLDGCSDIQILFKVVLPLSLPVLATFSLYYGVEKWNEWYSAMLYIKTSSKLPMQMVLRNIVQNVDTVINSNEIIDDSKIYSDGVKMATVVVTMLPIMCLYPFLQKYFVNGLTSGAVKE